MQIKSIELNDDEEPEFVTAKLTIRELAFLATLVGKLSETTANEVLPGYDYESRQIWSAVCSIGGGTAI